MAIQKALYTAHATSTGGRTGTTESSDGKIKLQLSTPKALGGDDGPGTNPEQLFASGYSACFIGALKAVAARQKIALPKEVSIKADVSIGTMAGKPGAFGIAVAMAVNVPGLDKATVEALVKTAHEVCPYSNATRGNIDVAFSVA
ncbi:MAG TPA: organic hydroperoxide resistance protein [Burkholderiaceae bacterium]|nr:organic hydroperoxide resistance protein [Burkholderiaceae bacterium]